MKRNTYGYELHWKRSPKVVEVEAANECNANLKVVKLLEQLGMITRLGECVKTELVKPKKPKTQKRPVGSWNDTIRRLYGEEV